jgi:hypothetical protein
MLLVYLTGYPHRRVRKGEAPPHPLASSPSSAHRTLDRATSGELVVLKVSSIAVLSSSQQLLIPPFFLLSLAVACALSSKLDVAG